MARAQVADAARGMKRFYKEAKAVPANRGVVLLLDGRPANTPGRDLLALPTRPLAEAIAEEWNSQNEEIDPQAMPLTGLANAAIDRVEPDPAAFAATLAAYGGTDLLCYRAEAPRALVLRQEALWDPLLAWARRRFDVEFATACGVIPRAQPEATVARLAAAVAAHDPFRLAALAPLVTISGSLLIALALAEGEIGLEEAWAAATLDETWQAEQWGADPLAAAAVEARRREFDAAYRFLTLL
jgi:chaperone required for assembly of F1-ATPase